jgi:hypothetical protein
MPQEPNKKWYPVTFSVAGLLSLYVTAQFGSTALICVGFPAFLIALWIGGGARRPSKIPTHDALLYIGTAVILVAGIVLWVALTTRK